ncbi:hypothetical protein PCANB_000004 [Pneumocystis canis]|nr:hypothetical protein PCK1_000081 [Pneumocystis canis]KAG5439722.1 hypothetical protein PCANB_000004 [Pneumocystis canis]
MKTQKRSKEAREASRKAYFERLEDLERRVNEFDISRNIKLFSELPLSQETAEGLRENHYIELTDIQKRAIPVALSGRDILGAARTGSGKTIAFLVPVLENLLRKKWTVYDGLGALIISPTRELALQIFQVLCKIGKKHNFSAGLAIGGKDLQEEAQRISRMNIMVCTPGRILQHMDQTSGFDINNLQILVLDETDCILDIGFQKTIDAIIENIPKSRQTLLFSATQTKSVKDLSRISLRNPDYIAVHEKETTSTPPALLQYYSIVLLHDKINTLFGFLKTHLKAKILVFMSTSKQVRFIYETFRRLQPGIPLLHLYGRKKQTSRNLITAQFSTAKHVAMFCTDIAARGLDFPMVDWVLQFDCPENADTYIHRVGRTARFNKTGKALMFLSPSEIKLLEYLEKKKVHMQEIGIKSSKDPEIKYLGQKACLSYLRSIYLQKDKEIFKFEELSIEEFSSKMGLLGLPKIKFLQGSNNKILKNMPQKLQAYLTDKNPEKNNETNKKNISKTKYDRIFKRTNQNVISDHYKKMIENNDLLVNNNSIDDNDDSINDGFINDDFINDDDDFMKIKSLNHHSNIEESVENNFNTFSKRKQKIAMSKKAMLKYRPKGSKLIYDEEGNATDVYKFQDEVSFHQAGTVNDQKTKYLEKEKEKMIENDIMDKIETKEKRRQKRKKKSTIESNITQDNIDNDAEFQCSFDNTDSFQKKQKKWHEKDSDSTKSTIIQVEHLDTLEDYENLALKLLNTH